MLSVILLRVAVKSILCVIILWGILLNVVWLSVAAPRLCMKNTSSYVVQYDFFASGPSKLACLPLEKIFRFVDYTKIKQYLCTRGGIHNTSLPSYLSNQRYKLECNSTIDCKGFPGINTVAQQDHAKVTKKMNRLI